jgi:hypothetical protein
LPDRLDFIGVTHTLSSHDFRPPAKRVQALAGELFFKTLIVTHGLPSAIVALHGRDAFSIMPSMRIVGRRCS